MCLEKYLNRLKGDFTYVLNNIEIEGMMQKKKLCTCIRRFSLYISLPSLHDYYVKMPNCKFYGGRKQATTNLFFSL